MMHIVRNATTYSPHGGKITRSTATDAQSAESKLTGDHGTEQMMRKRYERKNNAICSRGDTFSKLAHIGSRSHEVWILGGTDGY